VSHDIGVTREWLRALPKAEVHLHLEGCLPPDLLAAAARRRGTPAPDRSRGFAGLSDFLAYLDRSCGLLAEPAELAALAYRVAQRLAESGARYADVIVNPTHWPVWSARLEVFIAALDDGFSAAEADGLPSVGLCPSIERRQSREEASALVDELVAIGHPRVRGLSVDGNESAAGRTAERFAPAFARAAEAGLRRTAHAGESSGPEGVRDALEVLGVDRIDHGVRAIEDASLVADLARRGIPLGVCPTSNLTLGLYPDIHDHPIDRLRRAGVRVSLNTDDPELLDTSLLGEYEACSAAFGWSRADLAELARTSIEASFAPPAVRVSLLDELRGSL
jgi:adenosine deaminase